jgi:hypothetical protein
MANGHAVGNGRHLAGTPPGLSYLNGSINGLLGRAAAQQGTPGSARQQQLAAGGRARQ